MLDIENSFRPSAKIGPCHYQLKISGLAHDLYPLKERAGLEAHVGECEICRMVFEEELKSIQQLKTYLNEALPRRTDFTAITNEIKETTGLVFNGESLAVDDEGVVNIELPSLFNQGLRWIRQTIDSL